MPTKKEKAAFAAAARKAAAKGRVLPKTRAYKKPLKTSIFEKHDRGTLKDHLKEAMKDHTVKVEPGTATTPLGVATHVAKKILLREDDADMLEKSVLMEEPSRIGTDMGSIYSRTIKLTHGVKPDSQMRTSKKLYKSQQWPSFNTDSEKYYRSGGSSSAWLTAVYSSAGANRQGVYQPFEANPNSHWTNQFHLGYLDPLMTKLQIGNELFDNLVSQQTLAWLGDENNASSDLYYAINSIEDYVTFSNLMKYSPVELKIYLCKCKSRSANPACTDWFIPTGTTSHPNFMRNSYLYPATAQVVTDPDGGDSGTFYPESSVHLGATPFYSPQFRAKWDVVDVVKQIIMPTDKFVLKFEREFRHAHSLRDLYQINNTAIPNGNQGWWNEGDFNLVVTFKGLPSILELKSPGTNVQPLREVDAGPAKISMTSRSRMQINAPNLHTPDSNVSVPAAWDNYVSGEGRVLDTAIRTIPFSNVDGSTGAAWQISVVTNVEEKVGGSR